jgi:hypothetical protein
MKTAKTVLASSIFLGMAFGSAHAEICYVLTPFIDVIRVAETIYNDEAPQGVHTAVVGNWYAAGFYSLPVTGSLDVNYPTSNPLTLRLGLHGTNSSTVYFEGHSDCILDGFPNGAWFLSCDGRAAGIYNTSGSKLTVTPCDNVGPSVEGAAVGGMAAGQKR